MLLGFISLLLTVLQAPISGICISREAATSWHPCEDQKKPKTAKVEETKAYSDDNNGQKLLEFVEYVPRCVLATKGFDKCADQMKSWKTWEDETKSAEYQFHNDPERFRFTRYTTFGRRHLNLWSQTSLSLWIASFFRQFFGSVTKADYLALRHGFIMAHLAPGRESKFDFQKYINRSLEDDFKVVVGITPVIWFFAVLFLLTYTNGWYSYYWLPFIPLIIILLVGIKLQMIITKMGLKIHERGELVKGAPVVEPDDDLFWFNRPRLLLHLIHFVLFQNAFQLAFFAWSTMGSSMRPTIFNDRVAAALKNWHTTAKKHVKHSKHSEANTPFSSRPTTPTYGMSPLHLLHKNPSRSDSAQTSPRTSNYENEHWDIEGSPSPSHHQNRDEIQMQVLEAGSTQLPPGPSPIRTQHEIKINASDFSFEKPHDDRV
ncbi:hypothetical protein L6164_005687 [Bauhinia variegata]|uniref:Uncharacterized protein n=1 Tax=Bauhinia variegata TaxID=167791 RepID=A0ACB9PRK9_BAUVA|nr:hypothetical protein L6164_005687 [Bauhinia variegata]